MTLTNGTVLNLGNIRGADGIGITACRVTAAGELELTYTDGRTENVGRVTGTDGTGIQSVTLSADGELLVTLTDNTVTNLGNIKGAQGEKGEKGDKGDKGDPGRGIAKTELVNGELMITYTDGTHDDLGQVGNAAEEFDDYFEYKFITKTELSATLKESCRYIDRNGTIVVPSQHNGKKIVRVGGFTNSGYAKIVLPEGITSIDYSAFYNSKFLTEIVMPSTLQNIYDEAFYGCESLTNVTIPANVKYIGKDVFYGANLTTATFENPNNWKRYPGFNWDGYQNRRDVAAADLANSTKAAKLLTEKYLASNNTQHTYNYEK